MESQTKRQRTDSLRPQPETPDLASISPIDNLLARQKATNPGSLNRHRPLIPLIPKPGRDPRTEAQRVVRPSPLGPCGILQCDRLSCRLRSHRLFVAERKRRKEKEKQQRNLSEGGELTHSTSTTTRDAHAETQISVPPSLAGTTTFNLPLSDLEEQQPVLHRLFHDFFSNIVDRLHMLLIPPVRGYAIWADRRHQELFQHGTTLPLDCLNMICSAYSYLAPRQKGHFAHNDAAGIIIHSKLLRRLRDVLENWDPTKDAERVIAIIYTLVLLDLNSNLGRSKSLTAHRQAMINVVDSCGGLHNLGHAIPFAVFLDRTLALHTGLVPVYTSWESVNLSVQRAQLHPAVYGSFFSDDDRAQDINKDVLGYCVEVCRAIEILEGEEWEFSGLPQNPSPEIFYLYFLRERVTGKFVHLNARHSEENTRERCVLLAAKIVEYTVLMDNWIPANALVAANQLRELISKQNIVQFWNGWEDVFAWITSTLICAPEWWDGSKWAFELCSTHFQRVYGSNVPVEWEKKQEENVVRFCWSTTRLKVVFNAACSQLDIALNSRFGRLLDES